MLSNILQEKSKTSGSGCLVKHIAIPLVGPDHSGSHCFIQSYQMMQSMKFIYEITSTTHESFIETNLDKANVSFPYFSC